VLSFAISASSNFAILIFIALKEEGCMFKNAILALE
jgi:hypothetical protein